jgi:hypothetical protein
MFTIRKKLQDDDLPPNVRFNEEENQFEVTSDGGTTWTPDPSADPRTNTALLLPPADSKCAAANGMGSFVEDFLANAYTAFSVVGISNSAISLGLIAGRIAIAPLIGFIWALAQLMLETGVIALQEAFDEETIDTLRCIFYCAVDEDGRLTQASMDRAGIQIQTIISDGTVNVVMAAMFNIYGVVGFNNAGVTYADDDPDCDECDTCTWDHIWDATHRPLLEWEPIPTLAQYGVAVYTGSAWSFVTTRTPGSNGASFLGIVKEWVYDPSQVLTGVRVDYNGNRSNGNIYDGHFYFLDASYNVIGGSNAFDWDTGTGLSWVLPGLSIAAPAGTAYFWLFFNNNASIGTDQFDAYMIGVSGLGADPFPE